MRFRRIVKTLGHFEALFFSRSEEKGLRRFFGYENGGNQDTFTTTNESALRREIDLVCDERSITFTARDRPHLQRDMSLLCGGLALQIRAAQVEPVRLLNS